MIPKDLLDALRVIDREGLGDAIYRVRERVCDGDADDQRWLDDHPDLSSWDHPRVVAYGEAVTVVNRYLKSAPDSAKEESEHE